MYFHGLFETQQAQALSTRRGQADVSTCTGPPGALEAIDQPERGEDPDTPYGKDARDGVVPLLTQQLVHLHAPSHGVGVQVEVNLKPTA